MCKLLKEKNATWGPFAQRTNTAEMQTLIEALFWLNTCAEHKGLHSSSKVMITVGSLYVKGLIDEKFVAKKNKEYGNPIVPIVEGDTKETQSSNSLGKRSHLRCG